MLLRALDVLPVVVPAALAAFGAVATFLLLLGQLRSELVWPFGLIAALAVTAVIARYYPYGKSADKELHICNALAILGILVWGAFNILFTSQHVLTNRDPATYTNAGAWLIHHRSISIDIPTVFGVGHGVTANSAGFVGSPHIYAQGLHLLPIFLGLAGRIVGSSAMLHVNILLGMTALFAVYAFARQLGRQRWALVIVAALAASMPMLYFSRDTYTEPLAVTFTFGALALLWAAQKNGKVWLWFLAGVVAAAGTFTRIDAYLTIAAFCMFLVIWLSFARENERVLKIKQSLALLFGIALTGVLGWLDLSQLSTPYYVSLHSQFHQEIFLIAVTVLAGGIAIAYAWRTPILRTLDKKTASWRVPAAGAAILLIAVFLASRPLWYHGMGPIQPAKILGTDILDEYSAEWISWYVGPILALVGTVGLAVAAARSVKRRDSLLLCGVIVMCLTSLVYLTKPNISVDQIWASRRLLPVIMPGITAFAVISLDWLYDEFYDRIRFKQLYVVLAIIVILLGPLITSKTLLFHRDTTELAPIAAVCKSAPKNAAIVWLGLARLQAVMPTRSFCGIPAVGYHTMTADEPLLGNLKEIATSVRATGHVPIIGVYGYQESLITPAQRPNMTLVNSYAMQVLDNPSTNPPMRMIPEQNSVLLGVVQPDGSFRPLRVY